MPDFDEQLRLAQANKDYGWLMQTAKASDKMLRNFRAAILSAKFAGTDCEYIALGLNFIDRMIEQSGGQMNAIKRAEQDAKAAKAN